MRITAPADQSRTAEPMPPELAARVTAFARACKAAARSVALYPGEHPAVASALQGVTAAAAAATAAEPLQLSVLPDTLHAAGRSMSTQESAVTELAGILFRHQIGQLTVHQGTDPDLWRHFLALLAQPAEDTRSSGGLGRAWATRGDSRIAIRAVDYDEMLRSRARGDRATWEAILTGCLEGATLTLDDELLEVLADLTQNPGNLAALVEAVEARMPRGEGGGGNASIIAGLLQAVVRFVEQSAPDQAEAVMLAIAEALARLPVAALLPIVETPRTAKRPDLGRFVQKLLLRVPDTAIASFVAREVEAGRGEAPGLAEVFYDISPESDRRTSIQGLVARLLEARDPDGDAGLGEAWRHAEQAFASYGRKAAVPGTYKSELGRVFHRAVDLVRDHSDPPELLEDWRGTVDDEQVRLLDTKLLSALMTLRQDTTAWHDLSALVLNRINAFVVIGDLAAAAMLVENLRLQSREHPVPAIRAMAGEALDTVATLSTMKNVAWHLDTTNNAVVQAARRLCLALGTAVVGPLTETLSVEERERRRRHLAEILIGFGPPGRQVIERLCQSPSAAVRRTAIVLLRESGGRDVLPELVALLHDTEAHVQREAARALAEIGLESADGALVEAIERGPEHTRTCLLGALGSLSAGDAERLWARILTEAPWRGAMWAVHDEAAGRLASLGGRGAVDALSAVLQRRTLRAPFKMAALHRRCIDALSRIDTAGARAAIEAAASSGPRWVRASARARLAAVAGTAPLEGTQE
jgi:hypothetical protein